MEYTSYEPSYSNALEDVYRSVFDIPTRVESGSIGSSRSRTGGKAFASGGYGCVFRPAIRCKGEAEPRKNSISKLMKKKNAEKEMREVKDAKRIISQIPNYEKYFALADYHMCIPAKLSEEDKISFNEECKSPLGVTMSAVNKSPNSYRAIISPDLGIDLSTAIKLMFANEHSSPSHTPTEYIHLLRNLINLNDSASQLLKNGIAKMAKLEFYHSDVKPQNVMTNYSPTFSQPSFTEMKLIDFGLALPYGAEWMNVNSFSMFNAPFTAFMFNDAPLKDIDKMIKESGSYGGEDFGKFITSEMTKIVDKYVFKTSKRTHVPYIVYIGSKAYNMSNTVFTKVIRQFWILYCEQVVLGFMKYDDDGNPLNFNIEKYWRKVYRFNLDIWGFLTTFFVIVSNANASYPKIATEYSKIINEYLYSLNWATIRINVDDVIATLESISDKFRDEIRIYESKMIDIAPAKKTRKTAKKYKLVIVKEFPKNRSRSKSKTIREETRSLIPLSARLKKCPKGYERDRKDKTKCVKHGYKYPRETRVVGITLNGKKCPKGYKRHRTMKQRCVKKND